MSVMPYRRQQLDSLPEVIFHICDIAPVVCGRHSIAVLPSAQYPVKSVAGIIQTSRPQLTVGTLEQVYSLVVPRKQRILNLVQNLLGLSIILPVKIVSGIHQEHAHIFRGITVLLAVLVHQGIKVGAGQPDVADYGTGGQFGLDR